jgi:hypothetical protein
MDGMLAASPLPIGRISRPHANSRPSEPILVQKARSSLVSNATNSTPVRTPDGTSGAYFLRDDFGRPFAVFKPTDEEAGGLLDEKHLINAILPAGGGAIREMAAYLLDQRLPPNARAGVPETHLVSNVANSAFSGGARVAKSGSIQAYVKCDGAAESISPSLFYDDDVHRIGILDLRLFNLDRNTENILLKKSAERGEASPVVPGRRVSLSGPPCFHLVPIDHALSLPPSLHGAFFEWQHWPQGKVPFSNEILTAIAAINIDEDAQLLRSLGFEESSVRTCMISTLWLQIGAAAGLTLSQISSFAAALLPSQPSALEQVLLQIQPLEANNSSFRRALIDTLLDAARLIKKNHSF